MKNAIILLLMIFSVPALAQNNATVEQKLIKQYEQISYWVEFQRLHPKAEFSDSLVKANEVFQDMLVEFTKNLATLTAEFKGLKKAGIGIASSGDGKFRIYNWDTQLGGTMLILYNVYQYKSNGKIYSSILSQGKFEAGEWFSDLHVLKVNQKVYYLAGNSSKYSNRDSRSGIKIFSIENGKLINDVKLIKTKSGLTSKLNMSYDMISVINKNVKSADLMKYNDATKTIKMALIDEKLQLTDKFIAYKFNGTYFERQ